MRDSESPFSSWQIPLMVALGIILVVLAAVLLAQIDNMQRRSVLPPKRLAVVNQDATIAAGELETIYLPGDVVITATASVAPVTPSPIPEQTPISTAVTVLVPICSHTPAQWSEYLVKSGDSLSSLAVKFGLNKKAISQANCLANEQIIQGQIIFLPQISYSKINETTCGAPKGWIHYITRHEDTLLDLANEHGQTVLSIMKANCLESTYLAAGRKLFLPPTKPPGLAPDAPVHSKLTRARTQAPQTPTLRPTAVTHAATSAQSEPSPTPGS